MHGQGQRERDSEGQGQQERDGEAAMVPLQQAAHLVGEQVQYLSRYHTGAGSSPVLSEGLRITDPGVGGDYHAMKIHQDDVVEFARRIVGYRVERGVLAPSALEELEARIDQSS